MTPADPSGRPLRWAESRALSHSETRDLALASEPEPPAAGERDFASDRILDPEGNLTSGGATAVRGHPAPHRLGCSNPPWRP